MKIKKYFTAILTLMLVQYAGLIANSQDTVPSDLSVSGGSWDSAELVQELIQDEEIAIDEDLLEEVAEIEKIMSGDLNGYQIGEWVVVDGKWGFVGNDGQVYGLNGNHIGSVHDLTPSGDSGGSNITNMKYEYAGGMMNASKDLNTGLISIYRNDELVKSYYEGAEDDPTFTATYADNGRLLYTENQYGDVTICDELGRKEYSTHITQEYDEEGNAVECTQEVHITMMYHHDEFGRVSSVDKIVAKVDEDGNLIKDADGNIEYEYRTSVYAYSGATLVSVTAHAASGIENCTEENITGITRFNANETYTVNPLNNVVTQRTVTGLSGDISTTYYDASSGLATAYADYNDRFQITAVYDMGADNQIRTADDVITMRVTWDGAHAVEMYSFMFNAAGDMIMESTVFFDEFGNKIRTVQNEVSDIPVELAGAPETE